MLKGLTASVFCYCSHYVHCRLHMPGPPSRPVAHSTDAKSATTATTMRFRRKERRLMSYCTSDADAERRKGTANRFPGRRWWVMDSASKRGGEGGGGGWPADDWRLLVYARRPLMYAASRVLHDRIESLSPPPPPPPQNYAVYLFHLDGRPFCRPTRISDGY